MKLIKAIVITSLFSVAALASAKPAKCLVQSEGDTLYSGTCNFTAGKGGSFTLTKAKGSRFIDDVISISVTKYAQEDAVVSAITTGGNSSRWGEVYRDTNTPACWFNRSLRVCAW